MTRFPALWSLLTGQAPEPARKAAFSDYAAALVRKDTRAVRRTWEKLRDATNAELAR